MMRVPPRVSRTATLLPNPSRFRDAGTDTGSYGGLRDVVALSVGAREGIDNGTVFSIWREGSNVVDRVENSAEFPAGAESFDGKVRLPDEYAGHVIDRKSTRLNSSH